MVIKCVVASGTNTAALSVVAVNSAAYFMKQRKKVFYCEQVILLFDYMRIWDVGRLNDKFFKTLLCWNRRLFFSLYAVLKGKSPLKQVLKTAFGCKWREIFKQRKWSFIPEGLQQYQTINQVFVSNQKCFFCAVQPPDPRFSSAHCATSTATLCHH